MSIVPAGSDTPGVICSGIKEPDGHRFPAEGIVSDLTGALENISAQNSKALEPIPLGKDSWKRALRQASW